MCHLPDVSCSYESVCLSVFIDERNDLIGSVDSCSLCKLFEATGELCLHSHTQHHILLAKIPG